MLASDRETSVCDELPVIFGFTKIQLYYRADGIRSQAIIRNLTSQVQNSKTTAKNGVGTPTLAEGYRHRRRVNNNTTCIWLSKEDAGQGCPAYPGA